MNPPWTPGEERGYILRTMRGVVSFHPVGLDFFNETIAPLIRDGNVDLDPFLDRAIAARRAAARARRFTRALEAILEAARPPRIEPIVPKPSSAADLVRTSVGLLRSPRTVLQGIKTRLDQFDRRLDEISRIVLEKVEPELHLFGRPYLITESAPGAVADLVRRYREAHSATALDNLATEQLIVLSPKLAALEPRDAPLCVDLEYRGEVSREVRGISEITDAVRKGKSWTSPAGEPRSALDALRSEVPWMALRAHARAAPFWLARDVDGLATMCRATEIAPPAFLTTAARLFLGAGSMASEVAGSLQPEIEGPRALGGFVAPESVADLIDFLTTQGARIIRAASRHGQGAAAALVLKKIRECAVYAQRSGSGYLEGSGLLPPDLEAED